MKKVIQLIIFYVALPFIYCISLLPFPILYLLSDLLYVLLGKVFKYRQKVVISNLQNSFPQKSAEEILQISNQFYKFLCDLIVETLKLATISKKELLKRCSTKNIDLIHQLYKEQKQVIVVMGHYGNWEWGGAVASLISDYQIYAIYKPLSNPYFNNFFLKIRARFGSKMIAMNNVIRSFVEKKTALTATAFLAEQTAGPDHSYWINFLHQDTPVFPGPEKLAKKYDHAVVFLYFDQICRGHYTLVIELLEKNPSTTANGHISYLHTKKLEEIIQAKPHLWLWSHRKWKHKKPALL